ncbi:MAG: hypothetical protein HY788_19430 [Deltaproteobacteria bacterium]|nr:hypothetical protein [Deltaproteobacteria bacterium]
MNRLRRLIDKVILASFLLVLFSAGCATIPLPTQSGRIGETGPLGSCADFFSSLDQRIEESEVLDPGVFRVKGYPYLRVNRFLSSFREEVDDETAFAAWLDRLQELDREARKYEIANLPDSAEATSAPVIDPAELNRRTAACGDLLKMADFPNGEHRRALRERASASDEYITLRRVLGIYPFTGLFISHGVSKWHAEVHKRFSLEPPVDWKTIRYGTDREIDATSVTQIFSSTNRDALGVPVYTREEREALFRLHAPIWEIQIQGDCDRIGAPVWTDKGILEVRTGDPVTFTLLSFTRFGKDVLTQLNYIIWFPCRPKEGPLDIYGGLLDGVNYRVTLDTDGVPLLYETIHNCGCYYKAYPTNRLQVREKIDYAEPPLILKAPDLDFSKQFMTLAMESRTHFVQHLYPLSREARPPMAVYAFADYNQLRSLPHSKTGRRSMFGQDGIVPGSERLERFILWPTGVLSPGGMRQWGRHAVAFLGERQFDDPFFMDRMYTRANSH